MSIGIVTVATGPFVDFLPEWWRHVEALERKPDEVTVIQGAGFSPTMFNDAVANTSTDWIVKLDVDDKIFPHALSAVESCVADVYVFGVRAVHSDVVDDWHADAANMLTTLDNSCSAASPFRRKVWEAAPYRDMEYWDWAFWIEAARNGYTFVPSGTIDYEYRQHENQISASGDHETRRRMILEWRDQLCASS